MKKFLGIFLSFTMVASCATVVLGAPVAIPLNSSEHGFIALAATKKPAPVKKTYIASDLLGHFLIQKDSYDKLWYADPISKKRYFIQNTEDLLWLAKQHGIVITAKTLSAISRADATGKTTRAASKYAGRIVYVASDKDRPWYIDPVSRLRIPIDNYETMYALMKTAALAIDNVTLRKVTMNSEQLTYDAAFSTVAYVKYDGEHFLGGSFENQILPLASVSKIMTAMVLLDQKLDWEKIVTVTSDEINYPKTLVGDDVTSEVPLKAGDHVAIKDLWVSMLLASSNQSAAILADNSDLTRPTFIQRMNEKAARFGLTKTVFHDVSGLDTNNISTPREAAIMAQRAFSKYTIREATQKSAYNFTVQGVDGTQRTISVLNRNASLLTFEPDASKTGFLVEAQRNVVLKKGTAIIAILHALSMKQRNEIISRLLET